MKIENAIKKIEKNIGKVKRNGSFYTVEKNGKELELCVNGGGLGTVATIRVRGLNDEDDFMSDYHAGVYYENVTGAIRSMNN